MRLTQSNGLFTTELLEKIREKFLYVNWDPYTGERIYFEASGGSLRLRTVMETMARETALPDELFRFNPASEHVVDAVKQGIEDVKLFLGAESGTIMPAHSATHAIFRAINTVTTHIPGGNIVTSELEHPAVLSPTKYFAEIRNKEWRVAKLDREISAVPPENILELVDQDTCVLVFQHGSNQVGSINDAKYIVQEARKIKPDLYILVDAVQYAPHGPIDVEDIGADAYAFGPYKSYTVKGIGFAHLSERLARLPHWQLLGKPETDWVLGSPAHPMYMAWSVVMDYLCWLGSLFTKSTERRQQVIAAKDAIHNHMKALLERAMNGTADTPGLRDIPGTTPCTMAAEIGNRLCIFLFRINGMDSSTAIGHFNRDFHIRLAARIMDPYSKVPLNAMGWPDAIRLSAAHYNTPEEMDAMLRAAAQIAQRVK